MGSGWNMPEGDAELCQWELPAGAGDGLACRSGPRKVRASCLPGVPGACVHRKSSLQSGRLSMERQQEHQQHPAMAGRSRKKREVCFYLSAACWPLEPKWRLVEPAPSAVMYRTAVCMSLTGWGITRQSPNDTGIIMMMKLVEPNK